MLIRHIVQLSIPVFIEIVLLPIDWLTFTILKFLGVDVNIGISGSPIGLMDNWSHLYLVSLKQELINEYLAAAAIKPKFLSFNDEENSFS